jgi:hypothetical protein
MKKKKPKTTNEIRLGIRKFWPINPITQIVPNRKKKSRQELKKIVDDYEF